VTRSCDLCCLHCRASATPLRSPRELSTAEGLDLLDQLVEFDPGVLVLTGGDPFKRPDLDVLIEAAVGRGLRVAIAATGNFLAEDPACAYVPPDWPTAPDLGY
jgi:MoaA/NifB/PqqE/SkfB family radical SAM enzyme